VDRERKLELKGGRKGTRGAGGEKEKKIRLKMKT